MPEESHSIVQHPSLGYRYISPIPDATISSEFYQSRYYELIRSGQRAPDLRRLMEGGVAARMEREWLQATLYTDVRAYLEENLGEAPKHLLDVGCGTGDFLCYMKENGWEVVGLEPSVEAASLARERGLEVLSTGLHELFDEHPEYAHAFGAVSMLHVLEHVPEPERLISAVTQLLHPGGLLGVQVPNDFSELQVCAQAAIDADPWWIAVPDHVNYFDFDSLPSLFASCGFEVVHSAGTFPMELFLLMGDNYIGNPEVGSRCHAKRRQLELALSPELRRRMYAALARAGIGRDCILVARAMST
jgi:SAM-dependent methyltransferase